MGSRAAARGYFPLWLDDLEKSTLGWTDEMRFKYLRVLAWLRREGGFMPCADRALMQVAQINPGRGSAARLEQLKSKLRIVSATPDDVDSGETLMRAMVNGYQVDGKPMPSPLDERWYYHPRILRDLTKRLEIKAKKQAAGRKGGLRTQANAALGLKPADADADADVSKSSVDKESTAPDGPSIFWTLTVDRLVQMSIAEGQARKLVGLWLKEYPQRSIEKAIISAMDAGTHDPVPYITKSLLNAAQGYGNRARRPAI